MPFPRTNAHHQPPAAVSLPFRTPWLIPELRNSRPFLFFGQQMFFRSLSRPSDLYFKTKILFISANPVFSRSLVLLASHISSFRKNSRFSSLAPNFRASKVFRPRVGISFTVMPMSTSTNISAAVSMVSDKRETIQLLVGVDDYYGGVIVDMSAHMDAKSFVSSLRASIAQWKQQGKRGVWIKLPIELVHLVQPAVQEGFWYHHAELNYLMLVYWIPDTPHTLPVNASHRVGVGAIVMNDKGEMLVVQEKTGRLKGTGIWKIPTGVVDEGENIFVGAIREVKEETGIDAEFLEVLAFRQSHKSFFGKSDLFFVCMLRPLSFDIQKQESEIEAAQWMPVNEYAAQPVVQKHELLRYIADIGLAKASEKGYAGFEPVVANSVFADQHQSYLYLNSRDLSQPLSSDNGS